VGVAELSAVTDADEIVDQPPTVAPGEGPRPVVGAPGFWDRPERCSSADRAQRRIDPQRTREEEPIARSDENQENASRAHAMPAPTRFALRTLQLHTHVQQVAVGQLVYRCELMALDRGTLAKIDRKVFAELGHTVATQAVKVPLSDAMWSTWRRYCEAIGLTMGESIHRLDWAFAPRQCSTRSYT